MAAFADLEALDLRGTAISDRGLGHVGELDHLRVLELGATGVTDAGVVHLAQLSHLGYLGLANTRVTPAGVAQLAGMPELERLDLSSTAITGADVLRCGGFASLRWLSAADGTWTDVPSARADWLHQQAEQRRRADMQAHAASLQALAEVESAREQRRVLMDASGLLFLFTLSAVVVIQGMQGRAVDVGVLLTWAVITAPAIVAWCLKPDRPPYAEGFWVGGLLGGLVLATGILTFWRSAPLDTIDCTGPAVTFVALAAAALALAWPIRLARPRLKEMVIAGLLVGVALLLASPTHWPPDQSAVRFWLQYGLDGLEKLALISLWLWVTWTSIRLFISQLRSSPRRAAPTRAAPPSAVRRRR